MSQQSDSGLGSPLDAYDPETLRLASEQLLLDAHEARLDPKKFFPLVMRDEVSKARLKLLPHQEVCFDFMMAHDRCLIIKPIGTTKTFDAAVFTLWLLGNDPTARGAVVSASQEQALRVLRIVTDYIEQPELACFTNLVFPKLRRSPRTQDPWRQDAITVDRPPGIRDASLIGVGYDGALAGARLSWILVDDIYNTINTTTSEGLAKVDDAFRSIVLSRLDPNGRCVVINTPWANGDLTQTLQRPREQGGWPTLIMSIFGDITLVNVDPDWDSPAIRPSTKQKGDVCRLVAHDPDPDEVVPLWPEKFPVSHIEGKIRPTQLPHRFNQQYLCQVRDDDRAHCKQEWIDKCLSNGRGLTLVSEYQGSNFVGIGVDLAFSQKAGRDETAIVVAEVLPTGQRVLLYLDSGQWDSPTVLKKIIALQKKFNNSVVMVENNSAQIMMQQFARAVDVSMPVYGHHTGSNKANPVIGVESVFAELMNGAWTFPCDKFLRPPEQVKKLIRGLLEYEPPPKHTPDLLMSLWFAREIIRKFGNGRSASIGQAIGRSIMER